MTRKAHNSQLGVRLQSLLCILSAAALRADSLTQLILVKIDSADILRATGQFFVTGLLLNQVKCFDRGTYGCILNIIIIWSIILVCMNNLVCIEPFH